MTGKQLYFVGYISSQAQDEVREPGNDRLHGIDPLLMFTDGLATARMTTAP
jgi:hypothetical protein